MQLVASGSAPRTPKRIYDIQKIVIKGTYEEIKIAYTTYENMVTTNKHEFICKEKPAPAFPQSLHAMIPHVIQICGLNHDDWINGSIAEIYIKEIDAGTLVNLVAKCEIDDHLVQIKSPPVFPKGELLTKLNTVIAEAEDYIDGSRLQQNLFPQDAIA